MVKELCVTVFVYLSFLLLYNVNRKTIQKIYNVFKALYYIKHK